MSQFDVYRLGDGLVVNCQSDLLDRIDSRFVAPLVPLDEAPKLAKRLNPIFKIDETDYAMLTQAAAAVSRRELGKLVGSLADHDIEITSALDVLIGGV